MRDPEGAMRQLQQIIMVLHKLCPPLDQSLDWILKLYLDISSC